MLGILHKLHGADVAHHAVVSAVLNTGKPSAPSAPEGKLLPVVRVLVHEDVSHASLVLRAWRMLWVFEGAYALGQKGQEDGHGVKGQINVRPGGFG